MLGGGSAEGANGVSHSVEHADANEGAEELSVRCAGLAHDSVHGGQLRRCELEVIVGRVVGVGASSSSFEDGASSPE